MKFKAVREALEGDATTAREIADDVGLDRSHVSRTLKQYVDDDYYPLDRELVQGEYWYYLTEDAGDAGDEETKLPVIGKRDYDFQTLVPEPGTTSYVQARSERDEIRAVIDGREQTEQLARVRVVGPPGTGKTTLAESIAAERRSPYIEIQLTAAMRESDLIGAPKLVGDETYWTDGPLTRALLASQERETILVLDEVNRAHPKAKTALMPALDYRARVRIKPRGDEIVQGDPSNLVVISTMNEGADFQTFDLDPAEKRRLGTRWDIPYLGLEDADAEAALVADQAPVTDRFARMLVDIANRVRERSQDPQDRVITAGISADELIRWAQTYAAFETAGDQDFEDSLQRAAEAAVIRPVFDDDEARDAVRDVVKEATGAVEVA